MTIKIKVSDLLGRNKWTQKDLSEKTSIRPATVSMLYHDKIKRLDVDHLNELCKVFKCQPGDLFEYKEDDEQNEHIPDENKE